MDADLQQRWSRSPTRTSSARSSRWPPEAACSPPVTTWCCGARGRGPIASDVKRGGQAESTAYIATVPSAARRPGGRRRVTRRTRSPRPAAPWRRGAAGLAWASGGRIRLAAAHAHRLRQRSRRWKGLEPHRDPGTGARQLRAPPRPHRGAPRRRRPRCRRAARTHGNAARPVPANGRHAVLHALDVLARSLPDTSTTGPTWTQNPDHAHLWLPETPQAARTPAIP